MKNPTRRAGWGIFVLRGIIVALAALAVSAVYRNLQTFPRTEDAEVRANVVGIAPQVGASITRLHVVDNQTVKAGDLLFEMDARPFEAEAAKALARLDFVRLEVQALKDEVVEAEATLRDRTARAEYAVSHHDRLKPLLAGNFTSTDRVQRAQSDAVSATALVHEAEAAIKRMRNKVGDFEGVNMRIEEARAALRDASLRVSYCKVYAPCDGHVTNLQIAPGTYAAAGEQIFSLVDSSVWFVLANFRETDLKHIRPGQSARVYLMSQRGHPIEGIVQGIPRAVYPLSTASRSIPGGEGILSRVEPTFDFVQLAQRFPVRILLQGGGDLRMGGRAAVIVDTRNEAQEENLQRLQSVEKTGFTPPAAAND